MLKVKSVRLNSGAKLHFLVNPQYLTGHIQVMFNIGWRSDKTEYLGLAHLFEHLVGKRTEKYPNKSEYSIFLEKAGIISNAWTGPDVTTYYQSQVHEKTFLSLENLMYVIYKSKFDKADLEMEKGVVQNEANRYLDNDSSFMWHEMMKAMYVGTSMEKFFFGTKETINNITLETFTDFYEYYLNPININIIICLKDLKQEKKIVKFLDKFYSDKNIYFSKRKLPEVRDNIDVIRNNVSITKEGKTLARITLAYRIDYVVTEKDRIASFILRRVLGSGFSARLMKRLRDEMGLVYGVSVYTDEFQNGFYYFAISTSCDKDKKDLVISEIKKILSELEKTVTKQEIDDIIPSLEYSSKSGESPSGDASYLIDSLILKQKMLEVDEFINKVRKLKSKEVLAALGRILKDGKEMLVVLE